MAWMLLIATGLFYFILGPKDPAYDWRRTDTMRHPDGDGAVIGHRVVLIRDRQVVLPKLKLVYRGVENGRLFIEATLLELDPDVTYPHRIDPNRTTREFRMGESWFRLDSWNRSRVRLEPTR